MNRPEDSSENRPEDSSDKNTAVRRRRRGVTLLELLIVLVMTALLAAALGDAFTAELTLQRHQNAHRAALRRADATEQVVTRLLQGARLSSSTVTPATSPTTYFLGIADNNAGNLGCDRLTFTTTAPGVPMAALDSADDFETQQEARGPIGGLAEVSLAATPVGDANGQTGLFERLQRPSDADPTQGGMERVLDPGIAQIGFLFWNGQQWVPTWDTTTGASAQRLPQAVEVRYLRQGAPDSDVQMFVVPLPASDVSAQNPVEQGAAP